MVRIKKALLWIGCLGAWLAPPVYGIDNLPEEMKRVKGIGVPIYLKGHNKPSVIIRIESMRPDHERRGFFRIGVLPIVVADGVRLEVLDPGHGAEALSGAANWLSGRSGSRPVELRQVTLIVGREPIPWLEANRARTDNSGQLRLLDGITIRHGETTTRSSGGVLHLSGTNAGRVSWNSDRGAMTADLFSHVQQSETQKEGKP